MRKPKVDESKCEGFQMCVSIAPDVFEMSEKNTATVKNPQGADEATIQNAIDACPTQAISWEED